jgi:hypothetical protein
LYPGFDISQIDGRSQELDLACLIVFINIDVPGSRSTAVRDRCCTPHRRTWLSDQNGYPARAQAEDGPIPLGCITQANLARTIGATRQSISLVLSRLQDEGIISAGPTKMVGNDLAALRRQVGD